MKKIHKIIAMITVLLLFSGCTPKSQLYNTARDSLSKIESTCIEIEKDVEKLEDEYTTNVFKNILEETIEYKTFLESNPSKKDIESMIISLSRIEKELGSIKVLSSGMDDYTPQLNFEFTNKTDRVVKEITLTTQSGEEINAFSGEVAPDTSITISYPIQDGAWTITSVMDNDDEVTGENISLSTLNGLILENLDGEYEYKFK